MYGVALAGLSIVALGGIALVMLPSLRTAQFGALSENDHLAAVTVPAMPLAVSAAPAVKSAAPPFPSSGPKVILVGPSEKAIAPPPAVFATPPKPEGASPSPAPEPTRTVRGGTPDTAAATSHGTPPALLSLQQKPDLPAKAPLPAALTTTLTTVPSAAAAATAPIVIPPATAAPDLSAKPAAVSAAPTVAPAAAPFKVRLSYTLGETPKADFLANQLQHEGLEVTRILIPEATGRWPGVAFFFPADRDEASAIARQLSEITGRHEHARLSDRHPYPAAGTIEVSLLKSEKPNTGAPRKRVHAE